MGIEDFVICTCAISSFCAHFYSCSDVAFDLLFCFICLLVALRTFFDFFLQGYEISGFKVIRNLFCIGSLCLISPICTFFFILFPGSIDFHFWVVWIIKDCKRENIG